jgi:hypothetical protein
MTSFRSRPRALAAESIRRIVVTGSLIAALATVFAVLAGAGYAASHVTPAHALAASPQPSPAGDQYGNPSGFKSKCTLKANATYNGAVAAASKTLKRQLSLAQSKTARALAVKQFNLAVKLAKQLRQQSVSAC